MIEKKEWKYTSNQHHKIITNTLNKNDIAISVLIPLVIYSFFRDPRFENSIPEGYTIS